MGDWPTVPSSQHAVNADSITVSLSAGTNTKGAWVEFFAATPFKAVGIMWQYAGGYPGSFLVDIGIGAAGSEVVLVPDIPYLALGLRNNECLYIPVAVPAGVRVSARASYTGTSTAIATCAMRLFAGDILAQPLSKIDAYGVVAASSTGTTVDPGATANTKGAWVTIGTSLGIKCLAFGICNYQATRNTCFWWLDLGVGEAGSERLLIPDIVLSTVFTHNQVTPGLFGFFPFSIPIGVRIAARSACSINTANQRLINLLVLGAR